MIRSTRGQKAERLKTARRLLADETGMAEAAMALSRAFGLSRRQAYRYLELARAGLLSRSPASKSSKCRGEWVFEDDGYSGASLLRPGLERVRDLAAEGLIQAVLVYAPDRLSR